MNKRGQVTVFVILGIIIVGVILMFVFLRDNKPGLEKIPVDFQAPYSSFLSCLEDEVEMGVNILESRGGYIDLPNFDPGSSYMPFSNQLNFVGNKIPYWYYVSAGNVDKEQVPTKKEMEAQLENFIEERIRQCEFGFYREQGYEIELGTPKVDAEILDDNVAVELDMNLALAKADENLVVEKHKLDFDSSLGRLYSSALKIYEKEQDELFLEEYGIDVLNLYAPVNGVELSCSSLVWDADEVFNELSEAIQANTIALRTWGDKENYFYLDLDVGESVRFLNSKNWSKTYEVDPTEGRLMMSNPVGNQAGLGILGFCYVPYHFIYSLKYPVLVQVYEGSEIFQFPMAVIINKNQARESISSTAISQEISEFCEHKNTFVSVSVFDFGGNVVDAEIFYECSGSSCYIGKTNNGILESEFPQCVNGRIIARAEGFEDKAETYSVINGGNVEVILDKIYELDLDLTLEGRTYSGDAVVSFVSNDFVASALYPDQTSIELSPGEYNVTVYIYEDSELILGNSIGEQCVEVSKGGLAGILGMTEEKCYEVEIPEQFISSALVGGGHSGVYLLDSTLSNSKKVLVDAKKLPAPTSLEQLQDNYLLFDEKILEVDFI